MRASGRLGIVREPGYLYFLRGNEVWRSRIKGGEMAPGTSGRHLVFGQDPLRAGETYVIPPEQTSEGTIDGGIAQLVALASFTRRDGYFYFLNGAGDIAALPP